MNSLHTILPLAMRDTALTVTTLAHEATPGEGFESFRANCRAQLARLRAEFSAAGHDAAVTEDAAYAQCALLDEYALRRLDGDARAAWEHEPLQVSEFQSHNAGEELIARIERRLAEPQPVFPVLFVFHAVLSLGFQGKFTRDGAAARAALTRALDERLRGAGVLNDDGPVTVTVSKARPWHGFSPLTVVLISAAVACLIYLGLDWWLASAIADLAN